MHRSSDTQASQRVGSGTGEAQFSLNSASFDLPLTTIVEGARKFGFQGLELWAHDISAGISGGEIAKLLRDNDLALSAFQLLRDYEGLEEEARAARLLEAERLMECMGEIGADTLLLCANTDDASSGDSSRMVADLRLLADMAAQREMRIAFEPLAWSRWINTYEDAAQCIEAVDHPALGLAVDAFHWFWGGTPIEFVKAIPVHKLFEIQLCDARPDGASAKQVARHQRLFPGEGIWPVRELFQAFDSRGFDGIYNLEVFNDAHRSLSLETVALRAVASIDFLLKDGAR